MVPLVFVKLQENREATEMMEGDRRASEEHVQRKALSKAKLQRDLAVPLFRWLGRGLHTELLNVSLGSSEFSLFKVFLYIIKKHYFQGSELFCGLCYIHLEEKEVEAGWLMVLLCYQTSVHDCLD